MDSNEVEVYSAMTIANYIVAYCNKNSIPVNNLKLQKILYFAQGLFLNQDSKFLFKDSIEKWRYGPVIPEVYHSFKSYGSEPIKNIEDEIILTEEGHSFKIDVHAFDEKDVKENDKEFLNSIITVLKDRDVFELVELTHQQNGWRKDRERILNGERNIIYKKEEMIKDFITKI